MTFSKRLRESRKKQGLTLSELGNKINRTEATIQRYESGNIKNLKNDTIEQLEKQSEKLLTLYIEDAISKKILDSKMNEINQSIEALKNTEAEDNSYKVEMLNELREIDFDNATDQEKQNIINVIVDSVVITNDNVDVNLIF